MNFKKILLFLLGLFVCHNIVWVFKGNSATYIYIETIIALLLLFLNKGGILNSIKDAFAIMAGPFRLYITCTIFAILPSLLVFSGTRYAMTPINGFVFFVIQLLVFFAILAYRDQKDIIIKGIVWGFFLNVAYSVLCFFLYKFGISWRIIDYFAIEETGTFLTYTDLYYRAQGFFMECSYCMVFFASILPLCFMNIKNVNFKIGTLILVFLLAGISFTGNIAFILLSFVLFYVFIDRKVITGKQIFATLGIICVSLFLFYDDVVSMLGAENFFDLLVDSFLDLDVSDDDNISNAVRSEGILNSWMLVLENPLGVGYGCGAPLMDLNFTSSYGADQSTYSFWTRVALESGWIGFIFYITSIYRISKTLIFSHDLQRRAIGICVIVVTAAQAANGIGWFSFCLAVIALGNISYYEEKVERSFAK